MARKRPSRPIDILAAAAANDQSRHPDNHADRSGSGSESNKLSGSDPDSVVIPKPIEQNSPNRKSSRKRSLPKHRLLDESEGSSKKARVGSIGSVNRVWSEQDEIGLLQGMIEFKSRKGEDPYSDMNAFHSFVQDSISVHVSKKQVVDKIRKLKYKYLANAERGDVVFAKPHDETVFELSKVIWGGDGSVRVTKDKEDGNVVENGMNENGVEVDDEEGGNVVENGVNEKFVVVENGIEVDGEEGGNVVENVVNGKVDVVENGVEVSDEREDGGRDFKEVYPYLSIGWESDFTCSSLFKNYLTGNMHSVGSGKLREMDKKWKNLYMEELKLYVKKLDLVKEHAQAVLDRLSTSDS